MRVGSMRTVSVAAVAYHSLWYIVTSMSELDAMHTSAWVRKPAGRP